MSTLEPTASTPRSRTPSPLSPATPSGVVSEIAVANARFMTAFRNGNPDGVAACYSEGGTLLPPHSEPVRGTTAIASFWNAAMQLGISDALLETVSLETHGDLAVEEGRYTLRGADGGIVDDGTYLVIWRHEDDAWKIHHDIWNTCRPAPNAR